MLLDGQLCYLNKIAPNSALVLVKFYWVQLELLERRLEVLASFYVSIYVFSSHGVESSSG